MQLRLPGRAKQLCGLKFVSRGNGGISVIENKGALPLPCAVEAEWFSTMAGFTRKPWAISPFNTKQSFHLSYYSLLSPLCYRGQDKMYGCLVASIFKPKSDWNRNVSCQKKFENVLHKDYTGKKAIDLESSYIQQRKLEGFDVEIFYPVC